MKKIVSASTDTMERKARNILRKAQDLLDEMDVAPSELIRYNDLSDLYDELIETIPALSFAIKSGSLEY